jgi:hypothetical protein
MADTAVTFDAFWRLYPRRVARKAALRAWQRLSQADQAAALAALPAHAADWQRRCRSAEFIPHAATWLTNARWEDELDAPDAPLAARVARLVRK